MVRVYFDDQLVKVSVVTFRSLALQLDQICSLLWLTIQITGVMLLSQLRTWEDLYTKEGRRINLL